MRKRKTALAAAIAGLCLFAAGCQNQTKPAAVQSSEAESGSESTVPAEEESTDGSEETLESQTAQEESRDETEEAETENGEEGEGEDEPLHEIVVATDIHYLAEELAGKRCQSFVQMTYGSDGRVLLYGWEVMDAFVEDMKEKVGSGGSERGSDIERGESQS